MTDEPGPVEFCWCPETIHDERGNPSPCRTIAEVRGRKHYHSTDGWFTTVMTCCAVGHRCEALPDEVVLLVD